MTISNASLAVDGEFASEVDLNELHIQFPDRATVSSASRDSVYIDVLTSTGGRAHIVRDPEGLRLIAGRFDQFSDGPSYLFDAPVFSENELDCNHDGEVTFEDISCLDDTATIRPTLHHVGSPIGDTDGDQVVGFGDYLILARNFGRPGGYLQGDLDLNGFIEFGDYLDLSENYGVDHTPNVSTAGATSFSAVPEPGAGTMLGIVGLTLPLLRVRRKK